MKLTYDIQDTHWQQKRQTVMVNKGSIAISLKAAVVFVVGGQRAQSN